MATNEIEFSLNPADALTASVLAQIERQRDCPYCHNGKPITDTSVAWVAVEPGRDMLWFDSDKFIGSSEAELVEIHFCPMCGRRLGGEGE